MNIPALENRTLILQAVTVQILSVFKICRFLFNNVSCFFFKHVKYAMFS